VAPENLAIFTGTALKPRFYDSNQPQNHTKEKKERLKKRLPILKTFILLTLEKAFER